MLAGVSQRPAVISAFVCFVSLKEADVSEKGKVLHVKVRKTNINPKKIILLDVLILDHLVFLLVSTVFFVYEFGF
ncbi:hypothetical protein ASJ81_01355 [Methanosarcina spelaei]|uniref:Uncharacterized protein n=1 Tax=Methanosarcina spelaei TaxID=1036679 RepID=A0A2A2HTC3_9EURY|nr:hypothetical protein ASJ81_01355 [Methanosarcina spelaei]